MPLKFLLHVKADAVLYQKACIGLTQINYPHISGAQSGTCARKGYLKVIVRSADPRVLYQIGILSYKNAEAL